MTDLTLGDWTIMLLLCPGMPLWWWFVQRFNPLGVVLRPIIWRLRLLIARGRARAIWRC